MDRGALCTLGGQKRGFDTSQGVKRRKVTVVAFEVSNGAEQRKAEKNMAGDNASFLELVALGVKLSKKGALSLCDNWQGIMLLSVASKFKFFV